MLATLLFAPSLSVLVIGGGPDVFNNQVAIESNVRYLSKLIPPGTPLRTLFADGDPATESVRYLADKPSPDRKIGPFSVPGTRDRYRAPDIDRIDGPARLETVKAEFDTLARGSTGPAFVYFTGHGSLARDLRVSQFDLWSGERFAVPDLVGSLRSFDRSRPIVLLMVQCHSGDFANAIYRNGDPKLGLTSNRLCGFFASISARAAAGCTPEVNEAYYKDFSSYFLAALSGRDRLGRSVKGADYDGNGRVGMNEAFCWSLINDDSIDTPLCTSDVLLRNAAPLSDEKVFKTPYSQAFRAANPAQRAALEGLSTKLKLRGNDRLGVAYKKYGKLDSEDMEPSAVLGYRFVTLSRSVVLTQSLRQKGDSQTRSRLETLISDESANPLRS